MDYLDRVYKKNPNIVSRKIADEVLFVPIQQGVGNLESIYVLNEVGVFIWELIDGKRQIKQIKEIILEEFDVSPEEAENDLIELVRQMEEMVFVTDASKKRTTS